MRKEYEAVLKKETEKQKASTIYLLKYGRQKIDNILLLLYNKQNREIDEGLQFLLFPQKMWSRNHSYRPAFNHIDMKSKKFWRKIRTGSRNINPQHYRCQNLYLAIEGVLEEISEQHYCSQNSPKHLIPLTKEKRYKCCKKQLPL